MPDFPHGMAQWHAQARKAEDAWRARHPHRPSIDISITLITGPEAEGDQEAEGDPEAEADPE